MARDPEFTNPDSPIDPGPYPQTPAEATARPGVDIRFDPWELEQMIVDELELARSGAVGLREAYRSIAPAGGRKWAIVVTQIDLALGICIRPAGD
jgi:hypothetical protein